MWWQHWLVALLSPLWLALIAASVRAVFTRKLELGRHAFAIVIGLAVTGVTSWAIGNDAAFTARLDGPILGASERERVGTRGRTYGETELVVRSEGTTHTLHLLAHPHPACRPGAHLRKSAWSNLATCDDASVDLVGTWLLFVLALAVVGGALVLEALDRRRVGRTGASRRRR
jgi:hypothetical protein